MQHHIEAEHELQKQILMFRPYSVVYYQWDLRKLLYFPFAVFNICETVTLIMWQNLNRLIYTLGWAIHCCWFYDFWFNKWHSKFTLEIRLSQGLSRKAINNAKNKPQTKESIGTRLQLQHQKRFELPWSTSHGRHNNNPLNIVSYPGQEWKF